MPPRPANQRTNGQTNADGSQSSGPARRAYETKRLANSLDWLSSSYSQVLLTSTTPRLHRLFQTPIDERAGLRRLLPSDTIARSAARHTRRRISGIDRPTAATSAQRLGASIQRPSSTDDAKFHYDYYYRSADRRGHDCGVEAAVDDQHHQLLLLIYVDGDRA
uniref:Uncharacterized protein n=1 Tax=Plectus sambesii TaxID=2011161 RepID=A0A914WVB8_9BILA